KTGILDLCLMALSCWLHGRREPGEPAVTNQQFSELSFRVVIDKPRAQLEDAPKIQVGDYFLGRVGHGLVLIVRADVPNVDLGGGGFDDFGAGGADHGVPLSALAMAAWPNWQASQG